MLESSGNPLCRLRARTKQIINVETANDCWSVTHKLYICMYILTNDMNLTNLPVIHIQRYSFQTTNLKVGFKIGDFIQLKFTIPITKLKFVYKQKILHCLGGTVHLLHILPWLVRNSIISINSTHFIVVLAHQ